MAEDVHEDPAQRVNGITYLQLPAPDPGRAGEFYRAVFGWELRGDPERHLSFSDSTGHVIGAFVPHVGVAGDAGPLPYVFVTSVSATVDAITAHGGRIVKPPYQEPPGADDYLTVATFEDVAGNVLGVWQIGG